MLMFGGVSVVLSLSVLSLRSLRDRHTKRVQSSNRIARGALQQLVDVFDSPLSSSSAPLRSLCGPNFETRVHSQPDPSLVFDFLVFADQLLLYA